MPGCLFSRDKPPLPVHISKREHRISCILRSGVDSTRRPIAHDKFRPGFELRCPLAGGAPGPWGRDAETLPTRSKGIIQILRFLPRLRCTRHLMAGFAIAKMIERGTISSCTGSASNADARVG